MFYKKYIKRLLDIIFSAIMLVILCGIAHDFGIGILLALLAGVVGGIWLIKFSFEKIFHLYIRSWFSFSLWLFLMVSLILLYNVSASNGTTRIAVGFASCISETIYFQFLSDSLVFAEYICKTD